MTQCSTRSLRRQLELAEELLARLQRLEPSRTEQPVVVWAYFADVERVGLMGQPAYRQSAKKPS